MSLSDIFLQKCHRAPLIPISWSRHLVFFISLALTLPSLDGGCPDPAARLDGALQRLQPLCLVHAVLERVHRLLWCSVGLCLVLLLWLGVLLQPRLLHEGAAG